MGLAIFLTVVACAGVAVLLLAPEKLKKRQ